MLNIKPIILEATGASDLTVVEEIQTLWSGYGSIVRYKLSGTSRKFVVVKEIKPPDENKHPKGWNTNQSHTRKLKSYEVESEWYRTFNKRLKDIKTPDCLGIVTEGNQTIIVLEDLNEAGFPFRKNNVSWKEIQQCISWLATFHATYLNTSIDGLWKQGTYWHLATRPDELNKLKNNQLKQIAPLIDLELFNAQHKTIVHGDAKLANFCFGNNEVAGIDFQYVGGGCGMKDLAYFVGSCMYEEDCEKLEAQILDYYFTEFRKTNNNRNIEKEWRELYHVAWADFHRFLKGWSPDHWKINSYSEKILREVMNRYPI